MAAAEAGGAAPDDVKKMEAELKRREEDLRRKEEELRRVEEARRAEPARRYAEPARAAAKGPGADVMYVGVDFGTSRLALATSTGVRKMTPTVVGWPKDEVARGFLRKNVIFGEEALRNRLALDIHRPLEKGSILEEEGRGVDAARELFAYIMDTIREPNVKMFCVLGVPAKASVDNKQALMEVSREVVDAVMITSEPFMVAYGSNRLNNVLIVDVGAGTIDLCRVHGTVPTEDDQRTLPLGGDYIDDKLLELVSKKHKGAQVSREMVKRWKERSGTVLAPRRAINIEFPIEGVPTLVDLGPEMVEACRSIVPDIAVTIKELIATFDPEFQDELRRSVMLSGGGSQLMGLSRALEEELEDVGVSPVSVVSDPLYCGADGALKLAQDTPPRYWEELMTM